MLIGVIGWRFVAHAFVVARTDLVVFTGPALCAVAYAVAHSRFRTRCARVDRGGARNVATPPPFCHHDFHDLPEEPYQAFWDPETAPFPDGFKETALDLPWWLVLGGFALCAFLTWSGA